MLKNKIKQKKAESPLRVVLYGQEGIGKTHAAAQMEKPLFFDLEDGTSRTRDAEGNPVFVYEGLDSFESVLSAIKDLEKNKMYEFKTLVIDSIDWLEGLAHKQIIGTSGKDINRVNGGYGSGLRDSERMHRELVEALKSLQKTTECDIIALSHYKVKESKDPEAAHDYESYQLKLDDKVASIWKEWTEALLFGRMEVLTGKDEEASKKAKGLDTGKKLIYTAHRASAHAKNRYNLPQVMDFTGDVLCKIKNLANKKVSGILKDDLLILADKVTDSATKKLVVETIKKANPSEYPGINKRLKEITK